LPGDRVEIKEGKISVFNKENPDGIVLNEGKYLPNSTQTATRTGGQTEFTVEEGKFLVLGDNRSYSFDSRDWGLLKSDEIVGLVRMRLWPLDGFTVFAAPQYSE
jgi:signal peptidase I